MAPGQCDHELEQQWTACGHNSSAGRLALVSNESDRFRSRAKQCRSLAQDARDEKSRQTLNGMADDLDAEALKIDEEEAELRPNDA